MSFGICRTVGVGINLTPAEQDGVPVTKEVMARDQPTSSRRSKYMQTLTLSYVESLEKKVEILEGVVKRLGPKVGALEALLEKKELEHIARRIKNCEVRAGNDVGLAREDIDEVDGRLKRLEQKYYEEKDAHEETHKQLVALRRKVEAEAFKAFWSGDSLS